MKYHKVDETKAKIDTGNQFYFSLISFYFTFLLLFEFLFDTKIK